MCSGRGKKYNGACFVGPCVNNRKDCAQQTTRAAKRHRRSRRAEKGTARANDVWRRDIARTKRVRTRPRPAAASDCRSRPIATARAVQHGQRAAPRREDTRDRTTGGWGNVTSMRSAPGRKSDRPRRQLQWREVSKSGARGGSPAEIHGGDPYARSKRFDPRRDTARQTAGRRASRFAGKGMRLEKVTQKCGFVLIFPVGMQRTDHPAQR